MFKKYWREYPPVLQLTLLVLMMATCFSFLNFVFLSVVPLYSGVSMADLEHISAASSMDTIHSFQLRQFVFNAGFFLLPALLFSYLTHPSPRRYLYVKAPGRSIHWLLVPVLMVSWMPLELGLAGLIKQADFGQAANELQRQNEDVMAAILKMPGFTDFIVVFLLMAVVPAIGEELIFRGLLLRFAARRRKNLLLSKVQQVMELSFFDEAKPASFRSMILPILITSAIFASLHIPNVYGMVSIFLSGILLAVIFWLTGSLPCSILAHLVNNGLQVAVIYAFSGNRTVEAMMHEDFLPWPITVAGAALFVFSLYHLWKMRTPLPAGWTNDFTREEMENTGL